MGQDILSRGEALAGCHESIAKVGRELQRDCTGPVRSDNRVWNGFREYSDGTIGRDQRDLPGGSQGIGSGPERHVIQPALGPGFAGHEVSGFVQPESGLGFVKPVVEGFRENAKNDASRQPGPNMQPVPVLGLNPNREKLDLFKTRPRGRPAGVQDERIVGRGRRNTEKEKQGDSRAAEHASLKSQD